MNIKKRLQLSNIKNIILYHDLLPTVALFTSCIFDIEYQSGGNLEYIKWVWNYLIIRGNSINSEIFSFNNKYTSKRQIYTQKTNIHVSLNIMKKILLSLIVVSWILSFAGGFSFSGCEEKLFTVTAYYSPESGQIFYSKPTFQEEVILNGEGYTGASGKKVFIGMLAWPSTYPFWTSIYLPWLGIGEIADRGGAIVLSWEKWQIADRIDIRMWRGEEGLIRALTFGKKTMTGYVCDPSLTNKAQNHSIDFANVPILKYFFDIALWIQELKPERKDIRVWILQKYLNKLWYLSFKYRHGEYDVHTKKALCNYQVAKKIVSRKNPDCGTFGKTTRMIMKEEVKNKWLLPRDLYATGTVTSLLELAQRYNGKPEIDKLIHWWNDKKTSVSSEIISSKSSDTFHFYRAYMKWQQSAEIKILQNFLTIEWLYSWAIDGIYSKSTMNAVYEFQKKYSLISDNDLLTLRGYLGPKTRAKINELRMK